MASASEQNVVDFFGQVAAIIITDANQKYRDLVDRPCSDETISTGVKRHRTWLARVQTYLDSIYKEKIIESDVTPHDIAPIGSLLAYIATALFEFEHHLRVIDEQLSDMISRRAFGIDECSV